MERFAKSFGQSLYVDHHLTPRNVSNDSPKSKEPPKAKEEPKAQEPPKPKESSTEATKDTNTTKGSVPPTGKGKKETEADRALKKKFIYAMLIIAVILLILLSLWSCGLVFPHE